MTEATSGLATAAVRVNGRLAAFSELSASDLLAAMSDEQKAAIFASAPTAAAGDGEPDPSDKNEPGEGECPKCKDPMKDGKCSKCAESTEASAADPILAARAEERDRFKAVMGSEHYKGREGLAATLLSNGKLSADEIVAALAASGSASAEASDEAARAEMRAAISENTNSNVDANGGGTGKPTSAASVWDQAHASLNFTRKG